MNFVNQDHAAVKRNAKFIFGVHQNQACLIRNLLSAFENGKRGGLYLLPCFCVKQTMLNNLITGEALIMPCESAFGGGSDNRLWQTGVFLQTLREIISINIAFTKRVAIPQRRGSNARDVSAHNDFHQNWFGNFYNGGVWVGNGNDMILDNVARLLKPPCR